eukprot:TRINITY_DN2549_c0_g1_i1.p1 TRINITY_DN2549_c0_g1~~TRINITY_DN2549_c0_g1_i1.p1  ORF type:complete len:1327 (+),score=436.22 TRINITY_DN2549_c0_g1_i1:134-4114(+)
MSKPSPSARETPPGSAEQKSSELVAGVTFAVESPDPSPARAERRGSPADPPLPRGDQPVGTTRRRGLASGASPLVRNHDHPTLRPEEQGSAHAFDLSPRRDPAPAVPAQPPPLRLQHRMSAQDWGPAQSPGRGMMSSRPGSMANLRTMYSGGDADGGGLSRPMSATMGSGRPSMQSPGRQRSQTNLSVTRGYGHGDAFDRTVRGEKGRQYKKGELLTKNVITYLVRSVTSKRQRGDLSIHLLMLMLLIIMLALTKIEGNDSPSHFVLSGVKDMALGTPPPEGTVQGFPGAWMDVASDGQLWSWTHGFVDRMWAPGFEPAGTDPAAIPAQRELFRLHNIPLAYVLFYQVRRSVGECETSNFLSPLTGAYVPQTCVNLNREAASFGANGMYESNEAVAGGGGGTLELLRSKIGAERYDYGSVGARGKVYIQSFNVSKGAAEIHAELDALQANGWIDGQTMVAGLEWFTYNPSQRFFVRCQIFAEISNTGEIRPQYYFLPFTTESSEIRTPKGYAVLGLDILILLFVLVEGYGLVSSVLSNHELHGSWRNVFGLWEGINVLNIGLFIANYYYRFRLLDATLQSSADVTSDAKMLDRLVNFANDYNQNNVYQSLNIGLSWLRLFQYLQFDARLNVLSETIKQAGGELMALIVISVVIFMGYAFTGHLLYGATCVNFRDFGRSFGTLLRFIYGDGPYEQDGPCMFHTHNTITSVYLVTFLVIVWLVLLNLVLAIITGSFQLVQESMEEPDWSLATILADMHYVLRRALKRARKAIGVNAKKKKRKEPRADTEPADDIPYSPSTHVRTPLVDAALDPPGVYRVQSSEMASVDAEDLTSAGPATRPGMGGPRRALSNRSTPTEMDKEKEKEKERLPPLSPQTTRRGSKEASVERSGSTDPMGTTLPQAASPGRSVGPGSANERMGYLRIPGATVVSDGVPSPTHSALNPSGTVPAASTARHMSPAVADDASSSDSDSDSDDARTQEEKVRKLTVKQKVTLIKLLRGDGSTYITEEDIPRIASFVTKEQAVLLIQQSRKLFTGKQQSVKMGERLAQHMNSRLMEISQVLDRVAEMEPYVTSTMPELSLQVNAGFDYIESSIGPGLANVKEKLDELHDASSETPHILTDVITQLEKLNGASGDMNGSLKSTHKTVMDSLAAQATMATDLLMQIQRLDAVPDTQQYMLDHLVQMSDTQKRTTELLLKPLRANLQDVMHEIRRGSMVSNPSRKGSSVAALEDPTSSYERMVASVLETKGRARAHSQAETVTTVLEELRRTPVRGMPDGAPSSSSPGSHLTVEAHSPVNLQAPPNKKVSVKKERSPSPSLSPPEDSES